MYRFYRQPCWELPIAELRPYLNRSILCFTFRASIGSRDDVGKLLVVIGTKVHAARRSSRMNDKCGLVTSK